MVAFFYFFRCEGAKRRLQESCVDTAAKRPRFETTTIGQLPNEMLLEIFAKMDATTLKDSLQVARNWNQIITQNQATMAKLPLTLNADKLRLNEFAKLSRSYRKVTMRNFEKWDVALLNELTESGRKVTTLEIFDCKFINNNDFTCLISCFPILSKIKIRFCDVRTNIACCVFPVTMQHLRSIEIRGDVWMLDSIICPRLEKLKIYNTLQEVQATLIEFLNEQKSLKVLHLSDNMDLFTPDWTTEEEIVFNPQFNLRKLVLNDLPFADGRHLKTLLQRAHDCESIVIGYNVMPMATHYVIKNCHKLINLHLDAEALPKQNYFYYDLKPNTTLQWLKVDGRVEPNTEEVHGLISHYPLVDHLDFSGLSGLNTLDKSLWCLMSSQLKNLTYLEVRNCNIFNMENMKFSSLKLLEIQKLAEIDQDSWTKCGENNPKLHHLIIHSFLKQPPFDCDLVMKAVPKLDRIQYFTSYDYLAARLMQ